MTVAVPGSVYLTGAGPGDPDLLTVRAHRLLTTADAVYHDDLVPQALLDLCRSDAEVVSVGKRCGNKCVTQDEINRALIRAARSGRSVVRLKSGDPMVYGRASEELAALEREKIPCEVVPGVSALFAAAAGMRVSLTDRLTASRLIVLTAHRAGRETAAPLWKGDLPEDATIAIYMPGSNYPWLAESLLGAGLPRDMPCLVVSRAGTNQQQTLLATVATLQSRPPLPPPAVVLVGRGCGRHFGESSAGIATEISVPGVKPLPYEFAY
jgi:uroporphyrin-III C-methyltransferase